MKNEVGITVTKEENMPEWYGQVVVKSELADYSAVKGCAVIRPLGYALWENIQNYFNKRLKKMGVKNAYFPMFIPESFFAKEAGHIEGFAPEVAWIEQKSKDEERVAVRPTSETIMYDSYSKWIRSYRDLPLLINQWCNIVRWEVKDVKLFLRSREFLWQEGHCVFATEEECDKHVLEIIEEYRKVGEDLLAIPTFVGLKSKKETFPGAKYSYTIEQFMPDGKALQSGTSHNLGQGFAKAFDITFIGKDEKSHYPWQSSWGFSTRLLGGLIMMHGDDKGLVLPPRVAPTKVIIVPITNKKTPELNETVLATAKRLQNELNDSDIETHLDDRDNYSPGFKFNEWEMKGMPLRIELGPRDLQTNTCVAVQRNTGKKQIVAIAKIVAQVPVILDTIQQEMFDAAKQKTDAMFFTATDYNSMVKEIQNKKFALACHCGNAECEEKIKSETGGITTRCQTKEEVKKGDVCIKCGQPAAYKIIFARNY